MKKSLQKSGIVLLMLGFLLSAPVKASIIWDGDANKGTGVFGQFNLDGSATVTTTNDATYGKVWKFYKPSGSNRCESSHLPNGLHMQEGQEIYIGWRFKISSTVNNNACFQWKAYGSNMLQNFPIVLKHLSGKLQVMYNDPSYKSHYIWSTTAVANQWISIVIRMKVSRSASTGFIEFWYNGSKKTFTNGSQRYNCRTLDADYCDPKWGVYGASGSSITNYVDGLRIATTYNEANPANNKSLAIEESTISNLDIKAKSNPVGDETEISYSLPEASKAVIVFYNASGKEVERIENGLQQPGTYTTIWNATGKPNGLYVARIYAGGQTKAIKLLKN